MKSKTEKEKVLANELYLATDEELAAMQFRASQLFYQLNHASPQEIDK